MFKKRRGIKLPYNKQGLIYFTGMNIKDMSDEVQQILYNLIKEVTEEHAEALYAFMTDDTGNVHAIEQKYYISASQVYEYREKLYMKLQDRIQISIRP